jgi:hypothetical protein
MATSADAFPSAPRRKAQTQRRLAPDEVRQLIDAYRGGASANELSATFGIHRTTALDHLARNGIERRTNARKLNDEQVARASQMYRLGSSLSVVANHFRVNAATVAKELRAAGVELRPRRGWPTAGSGAERADATSGAPPGCPGR